MFVSGHLKRHNSKKEYPLLEEKKTSVKKKGFKHFLFDKTQAKKINDKKKIVTLKISI